MFKAIGDFRRTLRLRVTDVLGAAFLERMNALLAGGEVPGLFDGDEYTKLIAACKEEARKANKALDTEEEIYRQFTKDV